MINKVQIIDSDRLKTVSTQVLKESLAKSLEFTAKHLVYMGMLWRELELRGEDLSELKKGISVYIPMIAYNKIDAQLVVNYAGQKTLLFALAELTKDNQTLLLKNPIVSIINKDENIIKEYSLSDLPARYVFQLFNKHKIRNIDEQKLLIDSYSVSKRKASTRKAIKVYINANKKRLVVSSYHADIVNILSDYYKKDLVKFLKNNPKVN